ncbi:N utilization substance protein B [Fundidesulfovibrio magnetotacticus]|uniref:Transcription antitermination protein NusB n=1 Tax=Fundidesulfovibrio magnetotacticus TaxID=2730080 RepID=A0A6V8LT59_9BACT|nr:transcription antitermination factor NusB [Fundidesulfovibrio magnetotacticus]GFK93761.1 N utilization substance protein B [Fundidesulfovibrio magnetotacticus]
MSGPRTPRRRARRRAFQILYGFDFEPPVSDRGLLKAVQNAPEDPGLPEEPGDGYAQELVKGAWNAREELDKLISKHAQNWKIARIAKVELTILRLGVYEMLHVEDIPLRVALNEAVELAKEFGDENSPGFVNGVLDAVAKAVDQGKAGAEKKL